MTLNAENTKNLRQDAEARLKEGTAPVTRGWLTGMDALKLLYSLAQDPARASEAQKLLHELQVHQVELDLQHEQVEQNQRELTEDLHRYAELYNLAPIGYFTLGLEGKIIQGNLAGAQLLGVEPGEFDGCRIGGFLTPESQLAISELLKRVQGRGERGTCAVWVNGGTGPARRFHVVAKPAPDGLSFLVVFMDAGETSRD